MFATLVINAVFMTVASGLMFAFRKDTRKPRGDRDRTATQAVHIPRQHEPAEKLLPGPPVLAPGR
jgi:hypothetical protein